MSGTQGRPGLEAMGGDRLIGVRLGGGLHDRAVRLRLTVMCPRRRPADGSDQQQTRPDEQQYTARQCGHHDGSTRLQLGNVVGVLKALRQPVQAVATRRLRPARKIRQAVGRAVERDEAQRRDVLERT